MKPASQPDPSPLIQRLRDQGHRVLLVGGHVRDQILGENPGDPDLLTDAPIGVLEKLFKVPRVTLAGKSLPICIVNHMEIAPWRIADTEGDAVFPHADLARRDFTLNSMARDPESGELFDPFGGRADMDARIIRFTGTPLDRIQEDPLRMVRGCRFAARFSFELEAEGFKAIRDHAHLLKGVAVERLRTELVKAMAMDKPSCFFILLHETGLLPHMLPSLDRCWDLDGGPFHGETVFEHCMLVGDDITPKQPLLRLAGYLHDAGKFDAQGMKEGRITYHGHEKKISAVEKDLRDLRFSNRDREYILSLLQVHMRPLTEKTSPKSVRRLLAALAKYDLPVSDFMRMRIADKKSNLKKMAPYTLSDIRLRLNKIRVEQSAGHAVTLKELALSGNEIMEILGVGPGPRVGQIKDALLERILDDPAINTRAHLIPLVHFYKTHLPE